MLQDVVREILFYNHFCLSKAASFLYMKKVLAIILLLRRPYLARLALTVSFETYFRDQLLSKALERQCHE